MEPIRELIAVDLEMTGLQVKTDRILEIGAVRLVDGQLRDTFQTFVNPHRRIDVRITELTGILAGDDGECSRRQRRLCKNFWSLRERRHFLDIT